MAARMRGVIEVELFVIPFIDRHLKPEDESAVEQVERLLALDDLDLMEVLMGRRRPPEGVTAGLVEAVRRGGSPGLS